MFDAEDYVPERNDGTTLALTVGASGGGGGGTTNPDPTPQKQTLYQVATWSGVPGEWAYQYDEFESQARLVNTSPYKVAVGWHDEGEGPDVFLYEPDFPIGNSTVTLDVLGDKVYSKVVIAVRVDPPTGVTVIPAVDIGNFDNNTGLYSQRITFPNTVAFSHFEGGKQGLIWAVGSVGEYIVYLDTDPLSLGTHSINVFGVEIEGPGVYRQTVTAHVVTGTPEPAGLIVNPGAVEVTANKDAEVSVHAIAVTPYVGTVANRASGSGWTLGKVNGQFKITVNPKDPRWAETPEVVDIITFTNGNESVNFMVILHLVVASDLDLITVPGQRSWLAKNVFGLYTMWTGMVMAELYHSALAKRFKGTLTGVIESNLVTSWALSPKSLEWYIDDAVGIGVLAVQTVQEAHTPAMLAALSAGSRIQSEWTIPLVLGEKVFLPPSGPISFLSISRKYELQIIKMKEKAYTTGLANYLEVHFVGQFVNSITKVPTQCQIAGSVTKDTKFTFIVTRTMTAITGGFVDNTIVTLGGF